MNIHKKHLRPYLAEKALFPLLCLAYLIIISSCSTSASTKITPATLDITRSSPLRPLAPLHITITNKQAVQQLYQAAYKLPGVESGRRNCLNDDGIRYHFTFTQDKNTNDTMDLNPSGCLILTTSQGDLQENDQFLALVIKITHINPLVPLYQNLTTN